MKKWLFAGLMCGCILVLSGSVYAASMKDVVKTDMESCDAGIPVLPDHQKQMFGLDRIKQTLHGVWVGKVSGDYGKEFLDKEGFLNVDYYMIIDTDRNETLVIEQFTDKRSLEEPDMANRKPAVFSYLMCGNENYKPAHPRQIHDFYKVSDDINTLASILETTTGIKFNSGANSAAGINLADAWQKLVDTKYFDDLRYPAYAGGFFRNQMATTVNEDGDHVFSLYFETELRGGGGTAAEFESGEPIVGWESAQFVGVSTGEGDYLVASAGNGAEYGKQSQELSGLIDVKFEHVVIGPLGR